MATRAARPDEGGGLELGRGLRVVETAAVAAKPALRGRLHELVAYLSLPAGVLVVDGARTTGARVGAVVYAVTMTALFATSASYHRVEWWPRAHEIARRLDHAMIFVFIAGTATPVAILGLDGLSRVLALAVVWVGSAVGVVLKLWRFERAQRLGAAMHLLLGWSVVATSPQLVTSLQRPVLTLILCGGLLYTAGAGTLFTRRPDPIPRVFGYHEVWHTAVVAASACHYAAITLLVRAAV